MLRGARSNSAGRAAALALVVLLTFLSAQAAERGSLRTETLPWLPRTACPLCAEFLNKAWQEPAAPAASRIPTAQEIDSVLRELSAVTGFRIRRQLPFELITRDQVNKYLKEQIRQSVKPDEIRAQEVTLKKFGFAPADFDLKQTTIDLLTEQAAAFYDFHRKKLFISDWATVNMRDAALIHELAHALADQNFPIQKYLSKGASDSEASMAREAVVEGQASWLMLEVTARRSGRTLAEPETARELMATDSDASDSSYPVFNKAPLYLRRTLLFPYDDGERFQQALFLHDGKPAFARVFRQAPVSTAQIMHPDRYFSGDAPTNPDLPKPLKHARPFVEGSLGELETRILLEQYGSVGLADALGPKLKGSDYRVDEVKADHRMMLVYLSDWSDEDSAARYFDAYQKVLQAKWKQIEVSVQDAARFSGKSEDGYFMVVRDGVRILSQEGFAQPPQTPATP
jgi:hypothetical protein